MAARSTIVPGGFGFVHHSRTNFSRRILISRFATFSSLYCRSECRVWASALPRRVPREGGGRPCGYWRWRRTPHCTPFAKGYPNACDTRALLATGLLQATRWPRRAPGSKRRPHRCRWCWRIASEACTCGLLSTDDRFCTWNAARGAATASIGASAAAAAALPLLSIPAVCSCRWLRRAHALHPIGPPFTPLALHCCTLLCAVVSDSTRALTPALPSQSQPASIHPRAGSGEASLLCRQPHGSTHPAIGCTREGHTPPHSVSVSGSHPPPPRPS
jgi:hypothetical protein